MNWLIEWLAGGEQFHYMPRIHCMSHDWWTIGALVVLQVLVMVGYLLIAMQWRAYEIQNQKNTKDHEGSEALKDLRWIFVFCGLSGYGFSTLAMWWPGYRLQVVLLTILLFFTIRFLVESKRLELVYTKRTELEDSLLKERAHSAELEARLDEMHRVFEAFDIKEAKGPFRVLRQEKEDQDGDS